MAEPVDLEGALAAIELVLKRQSLQDAFPGPLSCLSAIPLLRLTRSASRRRTSVCSQKRRWPATARRAFLGALDPKSGTPPERQKARDLYRHLFRDRPLSISFEGEGSAAAERVRADLMGLVPLGAAVYLAEPTR
jgi:hypothetical protein